MVRRLLLGWALTVAAGNVASAAPADPDEIVVSGERLSPQAARERAIAFMQHTGIINNRASVARWIDPVCPRAMGLEPATSQQVEAKVREVAEAAQVPLATGACRPNVMINFVEDGAAFANDVFTRSPHHLAEVPSRLKDEVLKGQAPVRWWYRTELRANSRTLVGMAPPILSSSDHDFGVPSLPGGGTGTSLDYKSSVVAKLPARALRSATVVVDTVRAAGTPLDAVAAYAAMVALAEMEPRDAPFSGSILGLFGDQPARSLTQFDETFLRELYRLPLDRRARVQRGRLVRALQDEASTF